MLATHTDLLKVHGLDAVKAKTWTRRLKEYFELMNPMIDADTGLVKGKFPFYFTRRDHRGDIQIGRLISLFPPFPYLTLMSCYYYLLIFSGGRTASEI
jgi:hypothetical protein